MYSVLIGLRLQKPTDCRWYHYKWLWSRRSTICVQRSTRWVWFLFSNTDSSQYVLTAAHCIEGDAAVVCATRFWYLFCLCSNVYSALQNNSYDAISMVSRWKHTLDLTPTIKVRFEMILVWCVWHSPFATLTRFLNTQLPNAQSWDDIRFVGYGITSENSPNSSGTRRTVEVALNNSSNQAWPYTTDNMFLYTWDPAGQRNICSGDSGGAAFRQLSNGTVQLAGVNSFGFDAQDRWRYMQGTVCCRWSARVICITTGLHPEWTWGLIQSHRVNPVQNHRPSQVPNLLESRVQSLHLNLTDGSTFWRRDS